MVKDYKKKKVSEFREQIRGCRNFIFTDYQGMKVQELQALKKQLRDLKVTYRVVKNNLFRIALKEEGVTAPDDKVFANTLGVCFVPDGADISQALKTLFGYIKTSGKMTVKPSLVENRNFGTPELQALSELPPRNVLIARVIGSMKAPLSRLHGVLNGQMQKLVLVVKQIQEQKAKT
jgi:large subunit ribosomal protein L10